MRFSCVPRFRPHRDRRGEDRAGEALFLEIHGAPGGDGADVASCAPRSSHASGCAYAWVTSASAPSSDIGPTVSSFLPEVNTGDRLSWNRRVVVSEACDGYEWEFLEVLSRKGDSFSVCVLDEEGQRIRESSGDMVTRLVTASELAAGAVEVVRCEGARADGGGTTMQARYRGAGAVETAAHGARQSGAGVSRQFFRDQWSSRTLEEEARRGKIRRLSFPAYR